MFVLLCRGLFTVWSELVSLIVRRLKMRRSYFSSYPIYPSGILSLVCLSMCALMCTPHSYGVVGIFFRQSLRVVCMSIALHLHS